MHNCDTAKVKNNNEKILCGNKRRLDDRSTGDIKIAVGLENGAKVGEKVIRRNSPAKLDNASVMRLVDPFSSCAKTTVSASLSGNAAAHELSEYFSTATLNEKQNINKTSSLHSRLMESESISTVNISNASRSGQSFFASQDAKNTFEEPTEEKTAVRKKVECRRIVEETKTLPNSASASWELASQIALLLNSDTKKCCESEKSVAKSDKPYFNRSVFDLPVEKTVVAPLPLSHDSLPYLAAEQYFSSQKASFPMGRANNFRDFHNTGSKCEKYSFLEKIDKCKHIISDSTVKGSWIQSSGAALLADNNYFNMVSSLQSKQPRENILHLVSVGPPAYNTIKNLDTPETPFFASKNRADAAFSLKNSAIKSKNFGCKLTKNEKQIEARKNCNRNDLNNNKLFCQSKNKRSGNFSAPCGCAYCLNGVKQNKRVICHSSDALSPACNVPGPAFLPSSSQPSNSQPYIFQSRGYPFDLQNQDYSTGFSNWFCQQSVKNKSQPHAINELEKLYNDDPSDNSDNRVLNFQASENESLQQKEPRFSPAFSNQKLDFSDTSGLNFNNHKNVQTLNSKYQMCNSAECHECQFESARNVALTGIIGHNKFEEKISYSRNVSASIKKKIINEPSQSIRKAPEYSLHQPQMAYNKNPVGQVSDIVSSSPKPVNEETKVSPAVADREHRFKEVQMIVENRKVLPPELSKFIFTNFMGDGTYGFVVSAKRNGLDYAVKFIVKKKIPSSAWILLDEKSQRLVPIEIGILRNLKHPNIIRMIDFCENEDYFMIITELHGTSWSAEELKKIGMEGKTSYGKLRSRKIEAEVAQEEIADFTIGDLNTIGSLPLHMRSVLKPRVSCDLFECIDAHEYLDELGVQKIFKQLADAVYYMNSKGIVHRDIKDENIVIDFNYNIYLVDFGSAAFIPRQDEPLFERFLGTVDFASPEILGGQSYRGPEAEIWAMGVLLYIMSFRRSPFKDKEDILSGSPHFNASNLLNFVFVEDFIDLLRRMLEKDHAKRATINEVIMHPWINEDYNELINRIACESNLMQSKIGEVKCDSGNDVSTSQKCYNQKGNSV